MACFLSYHKSFSLRNGVVNYPSYDLGYNKERGQETTDAESLALMESGSEQPGTRRPQNWVTKEANCLNKLPSSEKSSVCWDQQGRINFLPWILRYLATPDLNDVQNHNQSIGQPLLEYNITPLLIRTSLLFCWVRLREHAAQGCVGAAHESISFTAQLC